MVYCVINDWLNWLCPFAAHLSNHGYVEIDESRWFKWWWDRQKPCPPFQGHGFFYIPNHIDMAWDRHTFDIPVCTHWGKVGSMLDKQDVVTVTRTPVVSVSVQHATKLLHAFSFIDIHTLLTCTGTYSCAQDKTKWQFYIYTVHKTSVHLSVCPRKYIGSYPVGKLSRSHYLICLKLIDFGQVNVLMDK